MNDCILQYKCSFTYIDHWFPSYSVHLPHLQFLSLALSVHLLCRQALEQPLVPFLGKSERGCASPKGSSVLNGLFPAGPEKRSREPLWKKPAGEIMQSPNHPRDRSAPPEILLESTFPERLTPWYSHTFPNQGWWFSTPLLSLYLCKLPWDNYCLKNALSYWPVQMSDTKVLTP